jgi:hypothetical protein
LLTLLVLVKEERVLLRLQLLLGVDAVVLRLWLRFRVAKSA